MTTIKSSAPPAETHGYRCTRSAHLGQKPLLSAPTIRGPFSARFRFCLRLITLGPMKPEHGGQQCQRGHHGERDADGGRHGQPVQEAHAEGEHAEQRDAHDDPGEEDRPARGVDRVDDGVLRVPPGDEALAVPRHDEEGIVHADAEPDQEHQFGRDRGHPDDMAEHADDADGGSQREHAPR